MKENIFLLISSIILCSFSSIGQEKVNLGPQPTSEKTIYKGVTDLSCKLEINFGSYGSGIDSKAMEKINALITLNNLKFSSTNIGREGETRICLPLSELKSKKKNKFIVQLKKIVKDGQLVSLSIQ